MEKLSKSNEGILLAASKGYKIIDGKIFNPKNKEINGFVSSTGYKNFTLRTLVGRDNYRIRIHRLVAYQKYGNKIFEKGIHVRHLDGNRLNNLDNNIAIGTASDNMMDIPKEKRLASAITATNKARKYSDNQLFEIRGFYNLTKSYKQTMEKFNIPNKSSLFNILKHNYITNK